MTVKAQQRHSIFINEHPTHNQQTDTSTSFVSSCVEVVWGCVAGAQSFVQMVGSTVVRLDPRGARSRKVIAEQLQLSPKLGPCAGLSQ